VNVQNKTPDTTLGTLAASDFIVHTLTVFEGAEAAALDRAEVSEHVGAALLWSWATTDLLNRESAGQQRSNGCLGLVRAIRVVG
jgi:hypothetical protein